MSNLKRLLNPDADSLDYPSHRTLEGWDQYGNSTNVPATFNEFNDASWNNYTVDLLDPRSYTPSMDQHLIGNYEIENSSLFLPETHVDDLSTQPSSLSSCSPETEATEESICYGMIYRASVRLSGDMADLHSKLNTGGGVPVPGHYQLSIKNIEQRFFVTFADDTCLGEVNAQLEKALNGIAEQQHNVEWEVFAPIKPIQETIGRAQKKGDAIVRVNVNVYGTRAAIGSIGKELSDYKLYLQRPDYVRPNTVYENPHMLKLANFSHQNPHQTPVADVGREKDSESQNAASFKETIAKIYSSLTRNQSLTGVEGDGRLRTKLLTHQKQALHFMSQREDGPIEEKYRLWEDSEEEGRFCYRHVITKRPTHTQYPETGGGILADEMGMGKTLSILALILRTLDAAHNWSSEPSDTPHTEARQVSRRRSRATLIVASSDLMINEWRQEMERHFQNDVCAALTMIKYHGSDRQSNISRLHDADLIITTYHTLAADFSSTKNPLHDIEWYRLVLDEAHIIRRQSTKLYRAVSEIKARSRWCLTGTPIQNRLEDIGSLFAFIRIIPFNSASNFRKYIAIPFDEGAKRRELAIQRFTRLLDSLCLRRTKDLLHLPEQENRLRHIDFSPEERVQYEHTKNMMMRAAKNQVGGLDQHSTLGLFQVQLQLRILSNHGTWQEPFSWNRRKLHLLDMQEAKDASSGVDGEVTCSACKQPMSVLNAGTMFRRFTEHCNHVLCFECLEESTMNNSAQSCPLCSDLWVRKPKVAEASHSNEEDQYFRPQGKSSKMEALMEDIQVGAWSSKSIVFSCWTHTLDLISVYLRSARISFERIDGECPTSKRQKILDDFAHNPQLRVLIMTTGTGAVGLNLATANRVFIVEPQWNPSVENQAIARALRLGQEQKVQVTRYVVNRTVEQEMRSLQKKKLEMAGLTHE